MFSKKKGYQYGGAIPRERAAKPIKMNAKQNKRQVLAAVLSGKIAPSDIPGEGVVIVSPGTPDKLDVDGVLMGEKEAVRAINRAETAIFFEGHEPCDTALLDKVAGQVDWVIDFNNDLNEVDNE